MDVVGAAYFYLSRQPAVTVAVNQRIYRHRLPVVIDANSPNAIVLKHRKGYQPSNRHNTMRHSKLQVEVYHDATAHTYDAESRADEVWRHVDYVLHRPRPFDEMWGDLRVFGAHRLEEYEVFSADNRETTALLVCEYGLDFA